MRRQLIALVIVTFCVVTAPSRAVAGENDEIGANPFISQIGPTTVNIGIERPGIVSHVVRTGASGVVACTYTIESGQTARQLLLVVYGVDVVQVDPSLRYVFRLCVADRVGVQLVATYRVGEPVTSLVVDALVATAYDHLEIPVLFQESAPRGDANAPFIVHMPVWLWVDPVRWEPVSEDASIPGARVVATATPQRLTWNPGTEREPVVCDGNGTQYRFDIPERAQRTSCTYTYDTSSAARPNEAFLLEVTVEWTVTWICEPACGSGSLPPFAITSSRPVRVAEIQALNTKRQQ